MQNSLYAHYQNTHIYIDYVYRLYVCLHSSKIYPFFLILNTPALPPFFVICPRPARSCSRGTSIAAVVSTQLGWEKLRVTGTWVGSTYGLVQ